MKNSYLYYPGDKFKHNCTDLVERKQIKGANRPQALRMSYLVTETEFNTTLLFLQIHTLL